MDEFNLTTFVIVRCSDVKDNARPQSFNPSSVVIPINQRDPKVRCLALRYNPCCAIHCVHLQAIDLIHIDPSLFPFVPSDGYINLTFGLPNFPTQFVEPSIIQDTQVLIETPFNSKNVRISVL